MEISIRHEVQLLTCGHFSANCDCDAETYQVSVHGEVIEAGARLEAEVGELEGLPGDLQLSDLDPREQELIHDALCAEAERRIKGRKQLGTELEKVAQLLAQMLANAKPGPLVVSAEERHGIAHRRIGALEFTMKQVRERLEELAERAKEAA